MHQFTVKINGKTSNVQGDPDRLTLRSILSDNGGQESGKQGGGRAWQARVAGRTYEEGDFGRTLRDLEIPSGAVIEFSETQTA